MDEASRLYADSLTHDLGNGAISTPSASSAVVLDCMDSTGLSSIGGAGFCVAIFYDTGHDRKGTSTVPQIVDAILRAVGRVPDDAAARTAEAPRNANNFARQLTAGYEADLPAG